MKRLVSAVLALSLLGTAAASAQPFRGNHDRGYDRGYDRGHHRDYRSTGQRGRGHNDGAGMIGLGIGLFALAAILSSQNQRETHYAPGYHPYDGYYGR